MPKQKVTVHQTPAFHIIIDNLFETETNESILSNLVSLKEYFVEATISIENRADKDRRTNLTCYIDNIYYKAFLLPDGTKDWQKQRIFRAENSPLLGAVDALIESEMMKQMMDSTPYPICKFRQVNTWETQVSRYGMNHFYTWHSDRLDTDRRLVSMVYYVHSLPKRFRGGALCITDGLQYNGNLIGRGGVIEIEPKNNRLVIFNSRTVHCVKPAESPDEFRDGRFSVNIWAGILGH